MVKKTEDETLFGLCRFCDKWVPRDNMKSANIRIYGSGVENIDRVIRLRICQGCYMGELERWESVEWRPLLVREDEIRNDEDLARKCDFVEFDPDGEM